MIVNGLAGSVLLCFFVVFRAGVRFNADKKKIGMYYTTPIYSFKMNCPSCSNEIELQTDPKNSDYVVAAGGSRKNERWDEEENGTLSFKGPFALLLSHPHKPNQAQLPKKRSFVLKPLKFKCNVVIFIQ